LITEDATDAEVDDIVDKAKDFLEEEKKRWASARRTLSWRGPPGSPPA